MWMPWRKRTEIIEREVTQVRQILEQLQLRLDQLSDEKVRSDRQLEHLARELEQESGRRRELASAIEEAESRLAAKYEDQGGELGQLALQVGGLQDECVTAKFAVSRIEHGLALHIEEVERTCTGLLGRIETARLAVLKRGDFREPGASDN